MKPDRRALGVAGQTFRPGDGFRGFQGRSVTCARAAAEGGKGFEEVPYRESAGEAGAARSGQGMVEAGRVVPQDFRRALPDKEGAVIFQERNPVLPAGNLQFQVLRGNEIRDARRFFPCFVDDDKASRFKGSPGCCGRGKTGQAAFQSRKDTGGAFPVRREEPGAGVGVVFGLGQHVGGGEIRGFRAGFACDDQYVRGAGVKSMPTSPERRRLAAATYLLPGPAITSARGMEAVPRARAATAWAPPTAKMRSGGTPCLVVPAKARAAIPAAARMFLSGRPSSCGGDANNTSPAPAEKAGISPMSTVEIRGNRPPGTYTAALSTGMTR